MNYDGKNNMKYRKNYEAEMLIKTTSIKPLVLNILKNYLSQFLFHSYPRSDNLLQ